jgi:hypothetical protein
MSGATRKGRLNALTAFLLMGIVMGMSSTCDAQNSPAVKVHAYEREVVGGIPGGPAGVGTPARQTQYSIYLETTPKAQFTVEGVWMGGKYYTVETEVRTAPIRFESPVKLAQEDKNIAVPATTNTVTEIILKDPVAGKTADAATTKTIGESQAAVQLLYQGKAVLVPVARFEKRDPLFKR